MTEKQYMVDTKAFMVLCKKMDPPMIITLVNCEGCPHHQGIREIYPGDVKKDEAGNILERTEAMRKAADLSLEPLDDPLQKFPTLQVVCGLPTLLGVTMHGEIMEEVG